MLIRVLWQGTYLGVVFDQFDTTRGMTVISVMNYLWGIGLDSLYFFPFRLGIHEFRAAMCKANSAVSNADLKRLRSSDFNVSTNCGTIVRYSSLNDIYLIHARIWTMRTNANTTFESMFLYRRVSPIAALAKEHPTATV